MIRGSRQMSRVGDVEEYGFVQRSANCRSGQRQRLLRSPMILSTSENGGEGEEDCRVR